MKKETMLKEEIKRKPRIKLKKLADCEVDKYEMEWLWSRYRSRSRKLSSRYKFESVRTGPERLFEVKFKEHFGWKPIPSFWIGRHQVDYFIPRLGAYVEIDGGIHYNEGKMKKDAYKLKVLTQDFGLVPVSFANLTVYLDFKRVIRVLSALPVLSERKSRILLKRLLLAVDGMDDLEISAQVKKEIEIR
ncbi:MAG TPA: hypothetical protein VKZ84_06395 [Bacteriovoracaceae bacterium]|nr:hypothetical protein [Bacteriovoracaceae bacterium]